MSHWLTGPATLTGKIVSLISLEETHFSSLDALAKDSRIWTHYVYNASEAGKFRSIMDSAFVERDKGSQFPFAILHHASNKLIGSTRLMDMQPKHRKLEIGTTWMHPDYWGTPVNLECKLLLLTLCFEVLKTSRVQLKTDENNVRSRKAIEKIGGKFEGIIRNDMVRDNNTLRNSALYSITDDEWTAVESGLKRRLHNLL